MRNFWVLLLNRLQSWKTRHRVRIREEHTLEYLAEESSFLDIALLLLVWAGTSLALMVSSAKCPPLLYQDDRVHSAVEIAADIAFSYLDEEETAKVRDKAASESPLYLTVSTERTAAIKADVVTAFARLKNGSELQNPVFTPSETSPETIRTLQECFRDPMFENAVLERLTQLLARGILDSRMLPDMSYMRMGVITLSPTRTLPPRLLGAFTLSTTAASQLARMALRPFDVGNQDVLEKTLSFILQGIIYEHGGNLIFDEQKTLSARNDIYNRIPPVWRNIPRGEILIHKNAVLTEKEINLWKAYRQAVDARSGSMFSWERAVYAGLGGFLLLFIAGIYVYSVCPEIWESNRKLWVGSLTLLMALGINSFFILFGDRFINSLNAPIPILELIPLGIAPALVTVTLGMRPGFIVGIYVSLATAIQMDSSFSVALGGIFITYAICYSVRSTINYRDFFTRILFTTILVYGGLKILASFSIGLGDNVWYSIFTGLMFNGVMTATLALVLLFMLEGGLGVSTDISLLAFANPGHPLMRRLQSEAPGTYRHSKMTADIAEQGALDIGANPVRARVGALYHDIGKLVNTSYFTENQINGVSPHANLKPSVSSMIILGHVKEGVGLAVQNNLPTLIRDAIRQHHGTDKVGYFYYKAMNSEQREEFSQNTFHYPGPLPEEKEVVIIALADACEAAVRSIEKPTHAKIEGMVNEIFQMRLKNGQMDNADLNFAQLCKLRESFVKTLVSMHHTRIAYPKSEEVDADDLFAQTRVTG